MSTVCAACALFWYTQEIGWPEDNNEIFSDVLWLHYGLLRPARESLGLSPRFFQDDKRKKFKLLIKKNIPPAQTEVGHDSFLLFIWMWKAAFGRFPGVPTPTAVCYHEKQKRGF